MRVLKWSIVYILGILLIWRLSPVEAQPKPFVGYTINGGCLYITQQGYPIIRMWNDTKEILVSQKVCE